MPDDNNTSKMTQREVQEALEKQVAQLKREVSKINRLLAEQAEEAAEEARHWYDGASDRASRATQALRSRAVTVSEAVRDNPGTFSSSMLIGCMVGFALGCLFSQVGQDTYRRWYY
ncbi:hypothetical protein PV773_12030 [Mesorhizobium sp. CC13]|uniref:hypothetical protein n=1 Tax=Mesorhizobium sp. CC13 TaxID=3029194 RepID=UPI00326526C7